MRDLPEIVGYKRSTLYLKIKEGTFPPPVKLGPRAVGWKSEDIEAWIENCPRSTKR